MARTRDLMPINVVGARAGWQPAIDVTSVASGFGISLPIPHHFGWRDRNRAFRQFGASAGTSYVLQTDEGARSVDARWVLGDFFTLLGIEAAFGRTLSPVETYAGATPP